MNSQVGLTVVEAKGVSDCRSAESSASRLGNRTVASFVQFKLDVGSPVWIDIEQVKAVTPAVDGGARLWMGEGDFFEVDASPYQVVNIVSGRASGAVVRHLHQVGAD